MFELRPYKKDNQVWDSWRDFDKFQRDFFGDPFDIFGSKGLEQFRTDIRDEGDSFVLEADMPGFKKEDISLDIKNDVLTIKAERHSEHEDKDAKGKYVRCERSYGSYSRQFDLSGIDTDGIRAKYDNGVLTLDLPKKKEIKDDGRRLEIE
ncbi:MAG: Hsp20/alpha crystallin family protein [Clostridia bacterium]|nr:Hsp20/alpha crystallin family protein [Clostridia bacterium]